MAECKVKVVLKPGKEAPVRRFHPWVFSGAVDRIEGDASDGDLAEVVDRKGNILGYGHYHKGSITVRLILFGEGDPSALSFWTERLESALNLRKTSVLHNAGTDCFRLVHGEGDGLSGLVVDVYGPTAVIQCHSIGMHRQRALIAEALLRTLSDRVRFIYDKSAETLPPQYAAQMQNGYIGPAEGADAAIVSENGIRFKVDWESGQKTGFFLDQRDNRHLLAQYAREKSILNTFCYTGGFSCYALQAGASSVHSVDISAKAMALTEENVQLNQPFSGVHHGITADVLPFLRQSTDVWDIVVVDPPAFAKNLDKRHNAVQGYKRLNEAAIARIKPGGLLFTFSCSQVVDRELFYHTIVAAALESGRTAKVIHHLTQGADHPVSLYHPEGAYLKGLVVQF